ncbi:FAD-binding oxidoreductase [Blastococcus sp. TF02A-35]|uniref:FAD-binding oxidoreductase n=1 Tax=Blastococcus sp. TF02A-35 TaxID=2559612 RepID=UPI001431C8D4|nr:FAD-binding oxidoreductase [Blastococcus sp. TF02A_35]
MVSVVEPECLEDVRDALRDAEARKVPVYPVSTGFNWGFGTDAPAQSGQALLRLHKMNKVRRIDLDQGWAVIEPGVSQGQLAEALTGSDFLLNVTASSQHTSVLGNALDRGVGVRRQRTDDVLGLEVVLSDGDVCRAGFWPRGDQTAHYRHGVGPSLLELFPQGNLGVVTAAVVGLIPVPERMYCLRLRFDADRLPRVVRWIARYQRQGTTAGVIKIYNEAAIEVYGGMRSAAYTMYVCIEGTAEVADVKTRTILEGARDACLFSEALVLPSDTDEMTVPEAALVRSYAGDPRGNDAMIDAVFGCPARDVETHSRFGWAFVTPMVPFSPEGLGPALEVLGAAEESDGITIGHTINVLPSGYVDLVVALRFERSTATAATVRRLLDQLHEGFGLRRLSPYRLDIDHMHLAASIRADPV